MFRSTKWHRDETESTTNLKGKQKIRTRLMFIQAINFVSLGISALILK